MKNKSILCFPVPQSSCALLFSAGRGITSSAGASWFDSFLLYLEFLVRDFHCSLDELGSLFDYFFPECFEFLLFLQNFFEVFDEFFVLRLHFFEEDAMVV
jgi:hypothetical protein